MSDTETLKRLRTMSAGLDNMKPITLRISRNLEAELKDFCTRRSVKLSVLLREITERGWKDLLHEMAVEQDPS